MEIVKNPSNNSTPILKIKSFNTKKIIIFSVIGLFILSLITFGTVAFFINDNKSQQTPITSQNIITSTPTFEPTLPSTITSQPTETASCPKDFHVFSNEFFSICYPSSFKIEKTEIANVSSAKPNKIGSYATFINKDKTLVLTVTSDYDGDSTVNMCPEISPVSLNIDGYKATRSFYPNEMNNCQVSRIETLIDDKDKEGGLYSISMYTDKKAKIDSTMYITTEESLNIKKY